MVGSRLCALFLCLLVWGGAGVPAEARLLTVSLDLRSIAPQRFQRLSLLSFQRKLLLRLTEAGFAVVGVSQSADIRLRVVADQEELRLSVRGGAQREVKRIALSASTQIAPLHLECLHKSMAAIQSVRERWPPEKRATPAKRTIPPTKPKTRDVARKKGGAVSRRLSSSLPIPNPWGLTLYFGGAWFYRLYGSDPLLRLGLRLGRRQGLGFRFTGMLSFSAAEALSVIEWGLQIGPSWRIWASPQFFFEFAAVFGLMHHIYTFEQENTNPDFHLDFVGQLQWIAGWQLASRVALQLWLGTGFAHQSRTHAVDVKPPLWNRSFFRLEVGALLSVRF